MKTFLYFILLMLIAVFLFLPKIFLLEIRVEKIIFIKVKFHILRFHICIFSKEIAISKNKNNNHFKKKLKKKNVKSIFIGNIFRFIRILILSAVIKVDRIFARIFCSDAFILSIFSAIIYSVWGILMSCGHNAKLDYKAFLKENLTSSILELSIIVRIFPMKLLTNWVKLIKKQKGGVNLGTSN